MSLKCELALAHLPNPFTIWQLYQTSPTFNISFILLSYQMFTTFEQSNFCTIFAFFHIAILVVCMHVAWQSVSCAKIIEFQTNGSYHCGIFCERQSIICGPFIASDAKLLFHTFILVFVLLFQQAISDLFKLKSCANVQAGSKVRKHSLKSKKNLVN